MSHLTDDAAFGGGNRATQTKPDDPLLRACEDFFKLNKTWTDANPEGNAPQNRNWSAEDRWRTAMERDEALRNLRRFRATRIPEIIEKCKVLAELARWKPIEDERVVVFALELIDEYNSIFLRKHYVEPLASRPADLSVDTSNRSFGRKPGRFNIQNILGMFQH